MAETSAGETGAGETDAGETGAGEQERDTRNGLWQSVFGQPAAVTALRNAVDRDEVAHAWLFLGPPGVGQREAARALAADLNCENVGEDGGRACGECSTCRRIAAGTHPASQDFEPEGAFHVVDAVRGDWIPTATRTLMEGRRQVLRVAAADRMNDGAQNAFLKVLEEPPPSVVWVLDVEDEDALLETVVSRCRRIDFVAWTPLAMHEAAAAEDIDEDKRDALVRAAMGSPQRLRALGEEDVQKARDRHLAILGRFADEGPGCVVPVAKEVDGWAKSRRKKRKKRNDRELDALEDSFAGEWPPGVKKRLEKRFGRVAREERQVALTMFLDDLASYLRDLLLVARGGDPVDAVNADHVDELVRDAARIPVPVLVDGLEAVRACGEALEMNGQPQLQLERLLLRIAVPMYTASVGR